MAKGPLARRAGVALSVVALCAVTLVCGASPAEARSVFAASFFTPESGDPSPGLSGVLRIDLDSGAASVFLPADPFTGLLFPSDIAIGPHDGYLYVGTQLGGVLRYDPLTGAPVPAPGQTGATFAQLGSGVNRIYFQNDGTLLVAESAGAIDAIDGVTGVLQGALGTGLSFPSGIAEGPGGELFVTVGDFGGLGSIQRLSDGVATTLGVTDQGGVFGASNLVVTPAVGDYDASGLTDQADYQFWSDQYDSPFADGNGDGQTNAADYTLWRDTIGQTSRLVTTDLVGNRLSSFDLAGQDPATLAVVPPAIPDPLPAGADLPSNAPSETLVTPERTLLVATLGLTRRPDNRGSLLEYRLDGQLLRVVASSLPPISALALAPDLAVSSTSVPEPAGLLAAAAAAAFARARRR